MSSEKIKNLKEKLQICKDIPVNKICIDDVDEISNIRIDKRKSSNERILDFLNSVKNPYAFKVNGRIVKISFSITEKTSDDCLTDVLKNLYR